MIATMTPNMSNSEHSLNTLRYADRYIFNEYFSNTYLFSAINFFKLVLEFSVNVAENAINCLSYGVL